MRGNQISNRLFRSDKKSSAGFTTIEILAALAVLLVIFMAGIFWSVSAYQKENLVAERNVLISLIMRARAESLASTRNSDHGLHISSGQYTIFAGSTYASRSAGYDFNYPRTGGLIIGGGPDIIFRKLDGYTGATSTISIQNGPSILNVAVGPEGNINW